MFILKVPIEKLVVHLSPDNIPRQIANAHTFFNIINVIIQLPFAGLLVKAANKLVPGEDKQAKKESIYLDSRIIETPSIALGQVRKEIVRMGEYVSDNLIRCQNAIINNDIKDIEITLEQEQKINKLQKEITEYLVELSNASLSDEQHAEINVYFNNIGDIERIGDHAENIIELAGEKMAGNLEFTQLGKDELNEMFVKCQQVFSYAMEALENNTEAPARQVLILEDEVDQLETINRQNHIDRLNKGQCQTSSGIIFLDVISNLERVSDHSANVALYVLDNYKDKS